MKALAIALDSLNGQDWADARRIMQLGGVDPDSVSLLDVQADPSKAPVPVLAALVYVALRKEQPNITQGRCIRIAQAIAGGS